MEIKYKYNFIIITIVMEFNSNNNKALIWGLLQESNIFKGIDNKKYNKVQELLEESINNVDKKYSNFKLIEKNKIVIEDVILKINKEKSIEISKSDKKIEVIYTSNDLSEKRKEKFNNKLKEQQDNLNTYINPKIPEEMNFKDDTDKPIGSDMDRLIAEKMASRERELDIPKISKEAEKWVNNSKHLNTNIDIVPEVIELNDDKKVTFNLLDKEIKNDIMHDNNNVMHGNNNVMHGNNNVMHDNNNVMHDNNNVMHDNVKNNIFNKLKRKSSDTTITNEVITRNEFEILKNNQEKILNICNILLEKMSYQNHEEK